MSLMKFFRKKRDIVLSGPFTRWYDKNTRENRLLEMRNYAKEAAKFLKDDSTVLEIAPGPGYLSIELSKLGAFKICGMDKSADFIAICKENARRENVAVDFLEGDVQDIPFEDCRFDLIVCSAAFKNFHDPVKALSEMRRTLKNEGLALIFDMNRQAGKRALNEEAVKISKNGSERLFVKITFKSLAKGAYTKNEFEAFSKEARFARCEIKENGIGLAVYLYKGGGVEKA